MRDKFCYRLRFWLFPLIQLGWWKQPWRENYLKERNFLQDKFLRFSGIFVKFAKLNPPQKNFFSFFRISKTYISTLGSLSINDNHVKNILLDNRELSLIQIMLYEISKNLGKSSLTHILQRWRANYEKIKIHKTLKKLRFAKIDPREKFTGSQFAKLNPREMLKNDSRI